MPGGQGQLAGLGRVAAGSVSRLRVWTRARGPHPPRVAQKAEGLVSEAQAVRPGRGAGWPCGWQGLLPHVSLWWSL